ncbi:MAG: hypothetical protein DMF61_22170 [Blastocatellia bacterium AA13]|nr:MAG: hypothetical protein DMF61_22170 [Blastocatellia bacterium AA13]
MSTQKRDDDTASDPTSRVDVRLTVGNKAVYPGQGPCRVGGIIKRVVDARVTMFYHLTVLDDNRVNLFVPVERVQNIGVRMLMEESEIPGLLAHLRKAVKIGDTWKQRATENLKRFNSASPYDLAEIVSSLTELNATRPLTVGEYRTLGRAKRLLICEISEVMGETKGAAEERVDLALDARTGEREPARVLVAASASSGTE